MEMFTTNPITKKTYYHGFSDEPFVPDDFTLELYRKDGTWIKQIMVDESYNVIEDYIGKNQLEDDEYYYSVWCIQYDNETGEEMCSFPMY